MKLGTIITDFKKAAGAVKNFITKIINEAPPVIQGIENVEAKAAGLVEGLLPSSTLAFSISDRLLVDAAQLVEDGGLALVGGLTLPLDAKLVADIKQLIADAKNHAASQPAQTSGPTT